MQYQIKFVVGRLREIIVVEFGSESSYVALWIGSQTITNHYILPCNSKVKERWRNLTTVKTCGLRKASGWSTLSSDWISLQRIIQQRRWIVHSWSLSRPCCCSDCLGSKKAMIDRKWKGTGHNSLYQCDFVTNNWENMKSGESEDLFKWEFASSIVVLLQSALFISADLVEREWRKGFLQKSVNVVVDFLQKCAD